MDNRKIICQPFFLGISRKYETFWALLGILLLLVAGLLLGLRQRGLWNREHGTHGGLQSLKGSLRSRHGQHSITSKLGGLQ